MSRKKVIRTASALYHVTARANNRDWFSLPMSEIWSIYETVMIQTQERYGIEAHAFVLMVNHFHLIAGTPRRNISEAMRYLLTEVSREIGRRTHRINHIFGGRYRWSVLWSAYDVAYVYKYVLRNPVRAGVCRRVEESSFSSFALGLRNACNLPIVEGIGELWRRVPPEPAARARWLNTAPNSDVERLVSLGLRHYEFALPTHKDLASLRRNLAEEYGVESVDNSEK